MSKRVMISIPVHEQPAVVENQLLNIQKFIPNSQVILHASADQPSFRPAIQQLVEKYPSFAYLNPISYPTYAEHEAACVTGLSSIHASSFQAVAHLDFDVWAINTSNDMMVREGVEQVFAQFSCAIQSQAVTASEYAFQDVVSQIRGHLPKANLFLKSSQEGSFYPKEVFRDVSATLQKMGEKIKGEEMYLPSLAVNLYPELLSSNARFQYVYHNPAHYAVTRDDIHKVQYGEYLHRYAVKRVPRTMSDPTRQYINQITGVSL